MAASLKKKILVTSEFANSAAGAFFQELGFVMYYKCIEGNDYTFVVNNACPDVKNIPRLQFGNAVNLELLPLVRSYINEDILKSNEGKKLLASYFNDAQEFDLTDRYSKELKDVYTVKVHEYLNLGFFIDRIIAEAYKAKFEISSLRNYLNLVLDFAFKKIESNEDAQPIDIYYSHNDEGFAVEISLKSENFRGRKELDGILDELIDSVNYFDATYFHKKKKLTFSSLTFKDQSLKKAKAYFFTEVTQRSLEAEKIDKSGDENDINLHTALDNSASTVKYIPKKRSEEEQSKRLSLGRKMALFIRNYRKNEDSPKNAEDLDLLDIDNYLAFYPRQDSIKEIDDEIKAFILKLVTNEDVFNGISDYVKKVASSNLDDQVQRIKGSLVSKSLSDIEEILMVQDNIEDGVHRVKGWAEVHQNDKEKWEVKKLQISEKLEEEVVRIKSEGRNIIENDIIRVVAGELQVQEDAVQVVVSDIVEEVVGSDLARIKEIEEAFAQKLLISKSTDTGKEKLEAQITRMKKIMDQMKNEIVKLRNEKIASEFEARAETLVDNTESSKLKSALSRTMEALKSKEFMIEKAKNDLKFQDQKINLLEVKIEELKADSTHSKNHSQFEKIHSLEEENRILQTKLDLTTKKVSIINDNHGLKESEAMERQSREIEVLKSNLQIAQSVIERLRGGRTSEEKEALSSNPLASEVQSKDLTIQNLTNERKIIEEKFKTQTMDLKKVEQKLKFTISQLAAANKQKGSAAGQKSSDAHLKQLEQANARTNEVTAEVAEKRKEIVKLKQENGMLSSKLAEVEKKLANMEKKAA